MDLVTPTEAWRSLENKTGDIFEGGICIFKNVKILTADRTKKTLFIELSGKKVALFLKPGYCFIPK